MQEFDRGDIIHNKKIKVGVLAIISVAAIIMIVLDCLDYIEKWG